MNIKIICSDDISEFEELRIKVFDLSRTFGPYYPNKYKDGQLIIVGAFVGEELVGATYLSPYKYDYGYIEQVFVKKEYQNSVYHVGTSLLKYIEEHIKDISEYLYAYLDTLRIQRLYIEYADEISRRVYADFGFKDSVQPDVMYKNLNTI